MCHAVPGRERTATMRGMNPEPPHITEAVGTWSQEELHWIVYEGVKMSGMPQWPSSREDDVWAAVAYLRAIQNGAITPGRQAEITAREALDAPEGAGWCAGCHGETEAHVPRLDIFEADYIEAALIAYREGRRESGIMQHAASEMSPDELRALAEWFAGHEAEPKTTGAAAPETLTLGEELARAAATTCRPAPPAMGRGRAISRVSAARIWRGGSRRWPGRTRPISSRSCGSGATGCAVGPRLTI
nr:c-type cytochrome [Limimaricola cinnabarinus]